MACHLCRCRIGPLIFRSFFIRSQPCLHLPAHVPTTSRTSTNTAPVVDTRRSSTTAARLGTIAPATSQAMYTAPVADTRPCRMATISTTWLTATCTTRMATIVMTTARLKWWKRRPSAKSLAYRPSKTLLTLDWAEAFFMHTTQSNDCTKGCWRTLIVQSKKKRQGAEAADCTNSVARQCCSILFWLAIQPLETRSRQCQLQAVCVTPALHHVCFKRLIG